MSDPKFIPAFQRGTAEGHSLSGIKIISVTATDVTSEIKFFQSVLDTIAASPFPLSPYAGESLKEYAERAAKTAGLGVADWVIRGSEAEDPVKPGEENLIH